jgi:hypothetical protein
MMTKNLSSFPTLLLALMLSLICTSSAFASATIVINNVDKPNEGFNDPTPATPIGSNTGTTVGQQRLNAFQHAANIWGAALPSGPNIVVSASWAPLSCTANSGTLGSAGTTSLRRDFTNAPLPGTWYAVALANTLAGSDLNGSTPEINARFNFNLGTPGCLENRTWYYGLDTNHNSTQINLVTVLLHEFAHGLGFASFTNEETGAQAGSDTAGRFPGIFDSFLLDNTTGKTWPQMTDAERKASAVNTGNLVWKGPQVVSDATTILTGGKDSAGRPMMFAPDPVDDGSSISHWSTLLTPNQLMEPNIRTDLSHSVSPPQDLSLSLMKDIGWCLTCPAPPPPPPPPPAPANDAFAAAQTLAGCSGSVNGRNTSATQEGGEPEHDPLGTASDHSVWYQWQAPSTGSVTITTAGGGTNFDSILGVYTGSSVNSLLLVANNDDIQNGVITESRVIFTATAGTIYRIAVDGYQGDSGNFFLSWTQSGCTQVTATVQLTQTGYQIGEAGGSAQVVVSRTDTTAAASVNYATTDSSGLNACSSVTGIASSRCDYATSIGTLKFAAGENTKIIYIPIVDDNITDGNETFTVTLSSPSGASLGTNTSAIVTITDNVNTGGNPVDEAAFFIRQHYIDFLGREPEPAGLSGWLNVYNNCGTTVAQPCDRVEISSAFFRSEEFQTRAYFVYRFYSAVGKIPLYEGFMPDFAKVSGFLSAPELEANKVAFINEFMTRADYQNLYGSIAGNDAYVTALLSTLGLPNHARKTEWVTALNNGTSRAVVLRAVTEDGQVYSKYFNEAFVIMQYFGYLRRSADISYLNWIAEMNKPGGDYRVMINGFLNSAEYRNRFQ